MDQVDQLDEWIAKLFECKPLSEAQVKTSVTRCDVSIGFVMYKAGANKPPHKNPARRLGAYLPLLPLVLP